MMTMRQWLRMALAAGTGSAALLLCAPAQAQMTGFTWEHATLHGGPRFGSDDLNFGAGLNAGYTLDMGVYLGGLFNYFLGESDDFDIGPVHYEYGFDAWFLMFDGGYDFGLADPFVLRPSLAMGLVTAHGRVCAEGPGIDECDSDTESEFEMALGGNAIYVTGSLTLGGELRFFIGEYDGVWMGFNIGTVF
jgi:hypothetical protein